MESAKDNNYYYIEALFTSGDRAKLTRSGWHGLREVFRKGRRLYPLEVFFRLSEQEADDLFERIKAGFYINEDVEFEVARYISSPELGYLDQLLLFAYNEKQGGYNLTRTHMVEEDAGLAILKGQLHAVHGRQRTALMEAIDAGAYCKLWCNRAAYGKLNTREKIRTFRDLERVLSLAIEGQTIALKTFTYCIEALRHDSLKWPRSLITCLGDATLSLPVNRQNTPFTPTYRRAEYALDYDRALLEIIRGGVWSPEEAEWLRAWLPPLAKDGDACAPAIWLDVIEYLLRKHHELSSCNEAGMAPESTPDFTAFRGFLRTSAQELAQCGQQMCTVTEPFVYADKVRGLREALAHTLTRARDSGLLARLCTETTRTSGHNRSYSPASFSCTTE